MPKFKNVSPLGALDLPLIGRVVERDEVIEVSDAQAKRLADQADWEPVKTRSTKVPDDLVTPAVAVGPENPPLDGDTTTPVDNGAAATGTPEEQQ